MRQTAKLDVTELVAEFDGDSLGDVRLDERLKRIVSLAALDPGESFPDQMASVADREALYRFRQSQGHDGYGAEWPPAPDAGTAA